MGEVGEGGREWEPRSTSQFTQLLSPGEVGKLTRTYTVQGNLNIYLYIFTCPMTWRAYKYLVFTCKANDSYRYSGLSWCAFCSNYDLSQAFLTPFVCANLHIQTYAIIKLFNPSFLSSTNLRFLLIPLFELVHLCGHALTAPEGSVTVKPTSGTLSQKSASLTD